MHEDSSTDPTDPASASSDEKQANRIAKPSASDQSRWLTINSHAQIASLLRDCDVCQPTEQIIATERAGEGNMNLTLRVRTTAQTVIVKQSRPWVEKYPTIAAPVDRILHELRFYETIASEPELAALMPRLLGSNMAQYVIILQCLGKANDATALYKQDDASESFNSLLPVLVSWLSRLHQLRISPARKSAYANQQLRELNHEHIFVIPFLEQPALDLDQFTPGLAGLAQPLSRNAKLLKQLNHLGELYLADHDHLIHGDFFPGSWLVSGEQVSVIDPEFSHGGMPEFDLGVLVGHGRLLSAEMASDLLGRVRSLYLATSHTVDWHLVEQIAAVEVMRRLLGVAQLPLTLDLDQKAQHINAAVAVLTT